jgi:hypothetical protein
MNDKAYSISLQVALTTIKLQRVLGWFLSARMQVI